MLPHDATIEFGVLRHEHRPVGAVCDGIDHGAVSNVVVKKADKEIRLAFFEDHNFTETMIRKVLKS